MLIYLNIGKLIIKFYKIMYIENKNTKIELILLFELHFVRLNFSKWRITDCCVSFVMNKR